MSAVNNQQLISAVIDLAPVIAGGLIGVIGGLAGNAFSHHLSKRESHSNERRSKLEQVVTAICETEIWLKKEENYYLFSGPENLEHSPIARIEAMIGLYFPDMHAETKVFCLAAQKYKMWMLQCRKDKVDRGSDVVSDELFSQLSQFYQPFVSAKNALLATANKQMAKEVAP